jgi:HD superfamily phosphodiesterase
MTAYDEQGNITQTDSEIKRKAVKASKEFGIPIIYLDKNKIAAREMHKIDEGIAELKQNPNPEKIYEVILKHENNRSGYRISNPEIVQAYFPTNKINSLISDYIGNINKKLISHEITKEQYKDNNARLIQYFESELKKFDDTNETGHRTNNIDIALPYFINRINTMTNGSIDYHFELADAISYGGMFDNKKYNNEQEKLSEVIEEVDVRKIERVMNDAILEKGLYVGDKKHHSSEHIERVVFWSSVLGEKCNLGIRDKELLLQSAVYHDCGRVSDKNDKDHGASSATLMNLVIDKKYSEQDKNIISVAIEYHEVEDEDKEKAQKIFDNICEKYNISNQEKERAQLIATLLKDADALDRTRFHNYRATLDPRKLRTEQAKLLVEASRELQSRYDNADSFNVEIGGEKNGPKSK